jgi:hypothetical protein
MFFITGIGVLALFQRQPAEGFQVGLPYELPKRIWTHWNSELKPEFIEKNLEDRRKTLEENGWTQIVLTDSNLNDYISPSDFPKNLHSIGKEQQADWLRLKLLSLYGGVWMDAGIILNTISELNALHYKSVATHSELTGYYIGSLTTNTEYSVIENYFLMAPKESEVIHLWLQEFENAIQVGFSTHKQRLAQEGVDTQRIYQTPSDVYLTHHACIQAVLQKRLNRKPLLLLSKAEESIFKFHSECEWKTDCLHSKLKSIDRMQQPPFVKLRGIDRQGISLSEFFGN